jgi:hypothetical protein
LLNQSIAFKNTHKKIGPKSEINPKQKFFLNLDFFLCVFKVKEHLMAIPLIIWNHFTQKSIILVAKLSSSQLLSLSRNPATPPLSSTKRRTKKKENEVWFQNIF